MAVTGQELLWLVIWKAGNRYRTGDTVRESAGLVMRCDDFPEIPAIGLNMSKIEPVFPACRGKIGLLGVECGNRL